MAQNIETEIARLDPESWWKAVARERAEIYRQLRGKQRPVWNLPLFRWAFVEVLIQASPPPQKYLCN
jgi:hypothetical protein